MKAIGRTVAWALMAAAILKSASSKSGSTGDDVAATLLSRHEEPDAEKRAITRLMPVPGQDDHVDQDIADLRRFLDEVFAGGSQTEGRELDESRTFGHKRIQFMLMPLMYKMGVMMTMLAVLTVISLKGLLIGAILLILKLSTVFAKFYSGLDRQHSSHVWSPPGQPIHVHIHNPYAHGQAYNGWEPPSGPSGEEHYYKG